MNLDHITLSALTHYADKLPGATLPHLGLLAYIGLHLSSRSSRRFFNNLTTIFEHSPARRRTGMQRLLRMSQLDEDVKQDAVREAVRLRRWITLPQQKEWLRKVFMALRNARLLREYCQLLDLGETDGQNNAESILTGEAFRAGGLVSHFIGTNGTCPVTCPPNIIASQPHTPTYDADNAELRLGSTVMRRYNKWNLHEELLQAFQEAHWAHRISIPPTLVTHDLKDIIRQLNKPQKDKQMLIRFRQDRRQITWEWRPS
jgi:hypothetical protein